MTLSSVTTTSPFLIGDTPSSAIENLNKEIAELKKQIKHHDCVALENIASILQSRVTYELTAGRCAFQMIKSLIHVTHISKIATERLTNPSGDPLDVTRMSDLLTNERADLINRITTTEARISATRAVGRALTLQAIKETKDVQAFPEGIAVIIASFLE